jgi:ubiquinone/menaquinone biosynthesis C-methylase UbiE
MIGPESVIQADFDRIALTSGGGWDHNEHYHGFLLSHVPTRCEAALDVGCGTGSFSRRLAERSDWVLALDLSPCMLEIARERSRQFSNIEFLLASATTWAFPAERFDCIASIATLHRLPIEESLCKMRDAPRPGGILLFLDLFQQAGLADMLTSLVAIPVSLVRRRFKSGRWRQP